jgi:hypothetical protein
LPLSNCHEDRRGSCQDESKKIQQSDISTEKADNAEISYGYIAEHSSPPGYHDMRGICNWAAMQMELAGDPMNANLKFAPTS